MTRAVYTALLGRYEALTEQPCAASSDVPFICFTDDPDLRSDSWDVRLVTPALDLDPVRSARSIKITGHPDLAAYDETLWIDARIRLTADPASILDEWLDGADLATPRHSYRPDVVTEFEEVLLAGLDDSGRLYESSRTTRRSLPSCSSRRSRGRPYSRVGRRRRSSAPWPSGCST